MAPRDADVHTAADAVDPVAHVPASLVVTAYHAASGIMNLLIPTSAVMMGGLAPARVPSGTYLRWGCPLLAILGVLTIVAPAVGAAAS